jgi:hypothetical protein
MIATSNLLKVYGGLEDADRGMKVRANGYDLGSGVGWFHFGAGWCVMVPEFQPNDYFRGKYVDAGHAYDTPMSTPKGIVIDFYSGRMALVTHPNDGDKDGSIDVLWEGEL